MSLGRPASDMQVVAVRKDGSLCQEGEIGEICLRGSNVCSGYWKNPEQSRAFETVIPGLEGYFYRTGDTNVTGTAEALRFACDGRPKYFHYVSSYSVYDNPSHFGREVLEDDPMESPEGYFLGYTETKWVAEKLVGIARQRDHLPAG